MAISRLQASLAQATNELTVAAANINFDFTLVKCEAPKEYLSLGNALSKKRKDEAEIGQLHITARRLGALFEGTCPATPNLIKAYGLRASEIAAHAKEHFAEPSGSIFAEQNGIDGTSIWAAATSSPAALHVQLLACMLARVWEVQQATSVWYELVKDRRKEVAKRYEEGENLRFATLTAAAQASITRSNLAEWDASARAWLRTADRVKNRAQQQLKLIVANMNIPVSSDMAVYSSVMAAWKSALESMEKLVSGMPQATNIGPPLLALSSWHLYPDLLAMGKREVSVRFDDPLVSPGGQLTIGLSTEDGEGRGVYWSLSLAHLNFYGSPVLSHGQFNVSSERLSFSQFAVAIFGSVMGAWHLRGRSINEVAELFIELDNFLAKANQDSSQGEKARDAVRRFFQNQSHWFRIMSNTAKLVLESSGAERDEVHKLIILGLRRSSELMPKDQAEPPFFGLCNSSELLGLMRGSVERVAFLRSIVEQCYSDNPTAAASLVIRIKGRSDTQAQYLTAVPLHQTPPHHRWLSDRGQQVQGESWSLIENLHKDDGYHWFTDASTGNQQTVREIYGDSDTATICQYRTTPRHSIPPPTLQTLIWSLRNNQLDALSLLRHLHYNVNVLYPLSATMFALSAAFTFYQSIPSATLNIKALNRPLFTAAWVPLEKRLTSSDPFESIRVESIKMARCRAFSCIAYMEACIDIPPSSLESVFALAHEDSLYLAMPLVCDPWEEPASFELRHVLGNVGRPGITLLIPPKTQMIRPVDDSSWRVASTTVFNGSQENHFDSTSLHLSFTEYYVPMHVTGQQNQDGQIFFLESYVSVHDSGKWVGDINILDAVSSPIIKRRVVKCRHGPGKEAEFTIQPELISVESWHDILDPPVESIVVRANGNRVARLAVSAMLPQILNRSSFRDVVICPQWCCWCCHDKEFPSPAEQHTDQDDYPPWENNTIYIY